MASEADAERRRALIVVRAASETAIDRLDPGDLDDLGLILRLQELTEFLDADLIRYRDRERESSV